MDNASVHRTVAVRELIESYHCTVAFLPPYSPDFNPIELSFSVLKAWIRRYMGDATQYDDFKDFLQLAVDSLDGEMAVRWFWKCGYRTGLY
jgi:transposase